MFDSVRSGFELFRLVMQRISVAAITGLALVAVSYCVAAGFGWTAWPEILIGLNGAPVDVGAYVAVGLSLLMASLLFFLPSHARVMALENSHRSFHMGMKDVSRAYALAHAADRQGTFQLKGEFDSIRERIAFLRDHPDLSELEPSVLELAAQMSHVSQELAQVYSDRNVNRARDFLTARQQEVETFNERLESAKQMVREVRPWMDTIEMEEAVARSQLDRLRDDLREILPEIWMADPEPQPPVQSQDIPERPDNVAHLDRLAAE